MALRDQPYIPLYVQDLLTDEKLIECSASAHGVYLRLLCILHKQNGYGILLLKQKYKQSESKINNFALMLSKQMPFDVDTINSGLDELLKEDVIQMNGDKLFQKRMVKDNELSLKRAEAGKKGGEKTQLALAKKEAKGEANTEIENEYEIEFENVRELYPGTKRGLKTEFKEFQKHKDWKQVLSLLKPAIQKQLIWRDKRKNNKLFTPEWKHFKTWIHQRCWEDELIEEKPEVKKYPGNVYQRSKSKEPESLKTIIENHGKS